MDGSVAYTIRINMTMNYDSTVVGAPYTREHRVIINYPDATRSPSATIEQSLAVRLLDGTARTLENLPSIDVPLNFVMEGDSPIPLINPNDGTPLGGMTSLNIAFLHALAIVRHLQSTVE